MLSNELRTRFALAIEKILKIEALIRAQYIRDNTLELEEYLVIY